MKISSRLRLAIVSFTLFFNVLAVTEAQAQVLNEILKKLEAHQKSLSSLRSRVTMEKYDAQLRESDVFEGTAIYLRAAGNQISVKIDWTKPFAESLSLINGQYVLYRPRLRQALVGRVDKEKENIKVSDALSFLTMSKKEIKANYNIMYLGQETVKGTLTWHLVFKPKKPDIYKSAEFWVNGSGMPIQAKVLQHNNDSTTVLLSDFKKNETINVRIFQLNLPKGTKIIKTSAGACPCFKPDNANDALRYWSDVVFSGKVTSADGADYTFKTERMWKDITGSEVVVRNFSTENNCAINLMIGERYVVFARKVDVKGKTVLGMMPCNSTSNIVSDSGRKILKEIGKGKSMKKVTVRKKRQKKN